MVGKLEELVALAVARASICAGDAAFAAAARSADAATVVVFMVV